MKKYLLKITFILSLFILSATAMAQVPPPPPSGGHGAGGNQGAGDPGGGAPIGGGLGILLALGAAYGGRKIYNAWQKEEE